MRMRSWVGGAGRGNIVWKRMLAQSCDVFRMCNIYANPATCVIPLRLAGAADILYSEIDDLHQEGAWS